MNLTIKQIRSWEPCYDPARYLPEGWKGTIKGILRHRDIPAGDKLWILLRKDVLSDKVLRLFAVDCARRALSRIKNPDPRSINAYDVAEKFAHGKATKDELARARASAAYADASTAASAAYAAYAAATYTADAAYAADAAAYAAYAAYVDAAYDAYAAATYTADAAYAARDVECKEQVKQLLRIIEENL